MPLLRAGSRPRASAELGYRMLAGVVVGGLAELIGVNLARDRNPATPDYLVPSLVAAAIGVAVAVIDPPDDGSGRVPDAWLDPDGRLHPAPYGHNQGARDILRSDRPGYVPTDEELRCCGVDLDMYDEEMELEDIPWDPGCVAEARLRDQGWQRVKGEYNDIGIELFSEPSDSQRNTLRRLVAGPNRDRKLYIDVPGDPCADEDNYGSTFEEKTSGIAARHALIDKAIACVNSGEPPECPGY